MARKSASRANWSISGTMEGTSTIAPTATSLLNSRSSACSSEMHCSTIPRPARSSSIDEIIGNITCSLRPALARSMARICWMKMSRLRRVKRIERTPRNGFCSRMSGK